ncbi:glutathione S-transferase family protein [Leeia oryzae]|uniref:glutathione S-transferase family protein n=1 Tax=Leeia oryzae TaxID=356662 RepID=UPI0003A505C4|nr:glutathione S-transferase family protein [Leeia oryzae]
MQLYGGTGSGHSFKVRSFLLLADIPHVYHWVDLDLPRHARRPDFLMASKFGEVPVLMDDGHAMCQSNAILMYLARKTGQYGGHADEWQTVLEWLCWESNRIGFSVPNLRYAKRWEPQPVDVETYLQNRAQADLSALDKALSQQAFLLPSGLTIADLSCSAYLFWLHEAGLTLADYPHVERWLHAIRQLPGWAHPDEALLPTA